MVGSSKILTVSYGTFSCTLEGFEDSFGTMKAIAEYFRDLAADDRYFGAEPPIPDADMLARIAEREIARRVEARMDASGIVLRVGQAMHMAPVAAQDVQAPQPAPVAAKAPIPAEAPVAAPVIVQSIAPPQAIAPLMPPAPVTPGVIVPRQITPIPTPAPTLAPTPTPTVAKVKPPTPIHPDGDSVAAKLQRIRAVVGKGSPGLVPMDFADDNEETAPIVAEFVTPPAIETPVIAAFLADPVDEVTAILDEVSADLDPKADGEPAGDLRADSEPEIAVAEPKVTEPRSLDLAPPEPDANEPATDTEPQPIAATPAPIRTPIPAPIRARVIKMRRADFDRAVEAGMLVEDPTNAARAGTSLPTTAPDLPELDDLSLDDITDQMTENGITDGFLSDDDADLDDLARLDGLDDLPAIGSVLSVDDEADLLAELEAVERETEAEPEPEPELIAAVAGTNDQPDTLQDTESDAERDAESAADMALMLMLARVTDTTVETEIEAPTAAATDLTGAIRAAGDAAAPVAEDGTENLFADDTETAQDDAAEADDSFDALGESDAAEAAIAEKEPDPHFHLRTEPEADEAALSRIMSQADAQLSEPEASRRREAIAQLRAAVAATEAARRLGETPETTGTTADESAFRDDLQQVVRPRRPMTPTAEVRSERPRPAPLKLVASQRVDLPQVAPRGAVTMPIRPRRVTIAPETPVVPAVGAVPFSPAPARSPTAADAGSFADFAADMGATSLADLLEAAAAYTAFVEGSEDFSRPQLLRKVTQMAPETYSREDGLRSFGTLLREGRIMRTRAGRFQVNEETRFNPDRRAS